MKNNRNIAEEKARKRRKREFAGEKARKWRRGLGALANSGEDARARVFPLELPESAIDFDKAARLFDIVEGAGESGPGALAGFICATHLSGFRLFSRAAPNPDNPEWTSALGFRPQMTVNALIAQDDKRPQIPLPREDAGCEPHKVVALAARDARKDGVEAGMAKEVQGRILGDDGLGPNGLLWLFGEGLTMISEKSDAEIARVLAADISRVRQLKKRADDLLPPPFCGEAHYRKFSQAVAGKLKSWISNYWKRLELLRQRTDDAKFTGLPSALSDPRAEEELFQREDFNFADLQTALNAMPGRLRDARKALAVLAGEDPNKLPGAAEVEKFDELNARMNELAGRLRKLKNLAAQRVESAEDKDDQKFWKKLDAALDKSAKSLEKFEKLNRISGGAANAKHEAEKTRTAFNALWNHRREQLARIAQTSGGTRALLKLAEADAAKELRKRSKDGADESNAAEFAVRKLLNRVGNAARKMRDNNREAVAEKIRPLFKARKDANKYFNNNIGAIFRSPYSRSIHSPFDLDWRKARDIDWLGELESVAAAIESRLAEGNPDDFRDWLALCELTANLRLQALPDELPRQSAAALADIPKDARSALRFSPALADALRANPLPRRTVVSAFNQIHAALRGLSFQITRRDFIVRVALKLIKQDELLCAPKADRKWNPPERYRRRYAETLAAMADAGDENGALNAVDAATALWNARRKKPKGQNAVMSEDDRAVLAELPHDWLFPVGKWRIHNAPQRTGFIVAKDAAKQNGFRKPEPVAALRLIGPNSLKTPLDDCLRGRVKLGESALILDRVCEQNFQWRSGELALNVRRGEIRAKLAVPVKSENNLRGEAFFDRLVAVDLGERGIGYAVFDIRQWMKNRDDSRTAECPVKTGVVSIPSIRALIRAVRRHRGRAQPMQKVRDTHSRALEKRRRNVIGDVCNAIDALCEKWRAFPVMEFGVQNLESGGKQLQLVYGSVLHRYADVDRGRKVEAHQKTRRDYWFTGKSPAIWTHPYLEDKKWGKPLTLYPGQTVPAAKTSQECSKCGRNPMDEIAKLPPKRKLVFRDGFADLDGGRIFLLQPVRQRKDDPRERAEMKNLRRQRIRPQMTRPLNGERRKEQLRALVKSNCRRPPVSVRSRDTSQSRYFCVFADCDACIHPGRPAGRAPMHADINAAVNIGRKFLRENVRKKSPK